MSLKGRIAVAALVLSLTFAAGGRFGSRGFDNSFTGETGAKVALRL